jgi:hypothetical protein
MEIADAELYRGLLEQELAENGTRPIDLMIVDDIAQWAEARTGNCHGNPPAMAVVDEASGCWGVLLRRSIDSAWVASIISRVECGGFLQARAVLSSPEVFLRHTVLHELAHLENGWGQDREDDCDEWAFDRLADVAPSTK